MRKALSVGFLAFFAAISLGIALFFGLKIYDTCRQDWESRQAYEQMAQYAVPAKKAAGEKTEAGEEIFLPSAPEENARILEIDFEALKEASPDLVGWLYCPDTPINYPIVQGQDNSYYLDHLADGSGNRNGCLFVDCRNRAGFCDENTLIYGHHMASGSMFASLVSYADQAYFEAHPVIYLITEDTDYRLELFAGYTAAAGADAYILNFASKGDFSGWLSTVKERSDFVSGVAVDETANIVTLSTCAYSFQDARYVVHGRLVENERKESIYGE